MPSFTPIFNLAKPFVADAIDEDLWGGYLNDNFDKIEDALKISRDMDTVAKTADYAVLDSDRNSLLLANAIGGNIIFTLPDAAIVEDGYKVFFKKTDASVNTVTIDGYMSQTIDGAANTILTSQYNYVGIVCDGSNWNIICENPKLTPAAQLTQAWGNFDGSVTTPSFAKQYNCSSVTKESTGKYLITLTTPMPDINYVITANAGRNVGADNSVVWEIVSTSSFRIFVSTSQSVGTASRVSFVVHGG